jgi:hypothetical protein
MLKSRTENGDGPSFVHEVSFFNTVTCSGVYVTIKTGFGLDDRI